MKRQTKKQLEQLKKLNTLIAIARYRYPNLYKSLGAFYVRQYLKDLV